MIKRNSNRKLTLEQRVTRLENAIKASRRNIRRKFESVDMALALKNALKVLLNSYEDTENLDDDSMAFYRINVTGNGDRLVADISEKDPDEWSIRGKFTVVPVGGKFEVNVIDDDGKLEYNLNTANNIKDAAKLIAKEIHEWEADL